MRKRIRSLGLDLPLSWEPLPDTRSGRGGGTFMLAAPAAPAPAPTVDTYVPRVTAATGSGDRGFLPERAPEPAPTYDMRSAPSYVAPTYDTRYYETEPAMVYEVAPSTYDVAPSPGVAATWTTPAAADPNGTLRSAEGSSSYMDIKICSNKAAAPPSPVEPLVVVTAAEPGAPVQPVVTPGTTASATASAEYPAARGSGMLWGLLIGAAVVYLLRRE